MIPQEYDETSFEIDHIIAKKHGSLTIARNLALSCYHCNSFKGSDVGSLDKPTRRLTPLFHPRRHSRRRHFRWQDGFLLGRTAIGRVTVALLNINDPFRVELREMLIEEGNFPPF
ncbi:MAG TPA: HNH endonuclease signature motif containing protein [Gemmataceae bacterium]|nr:HNH endonuclease signature motif containing protein [Gemmataceae bacterium]